MECKDGPPSCWEHDEEDDTPGPIGAEESVSERMYLCDAGVRAHRPHTVPFHRVDVAAQHEAFLSAQRLGARRVRATYRRWCIYNIELHVENMEAHHTGEQQLGVSSAVRYGNVGKR